MKIGILTSGGDCAGLNAVMRAIGLYAYRNIKNCEIVGIPDGYGGLIRGESAPMDREDFEGLLNLGGTILGTRRTPFKTMTVPEENGETRLEKMRANYKKMGLDCLFTLGGAGTHRTAALLCAEGCNVIGLPKTIDNDIYGTDVTFGFHTAVDVATEAIDRVRTTAASHGRTILVEVMGNKAGWLTLYAGIAAGAEVILLPEIPFNIDKICEAIRENCEEGKPCNIIAVGEGAVLDSEARFKKKERVFVRTERGETTVTQHLAEVIGERTGIETRGTVYPARRESFAVRSGTLFQIGKLCGKTCGAGAIRRHGSRRGQGYHFQRAARHRREVQVCRSDVGYRAPGRGYRRLFRKVSGQRGQEKT